MSNPFRNAPGATIRRPVTVNQPFSRLTDGEHHPVTTRVILAISEADDANVPAHQAVTGSRGLCGCGQPVTKVQHATLGDRPQWIHDCRPEHAHPVQNVRCITRP